MRGQRRLRRGWGGGCVDDEELVGGESGIGQIQDTTAMETLNG
jgi:hypothetical protein